MCRSSTNDGRHLDWDLFDGCRREAETLFFQFDALFAVQYETEPIIKRNFGELSVREGRPMRTDKVTKDALSAALTFQPVA